MRLAQGEAFMCGLHASRTTTGHHSDDWEDEASASATLDRSRLHNVRHVCSPTCESNPGDFVGKVSQVTSSHLKLCQPAFSPVRVMIRLKLGFQVKVHYEALIYYFEVFLRNAEGEFDLRLESEGKKNSRKNTVWTCTMGKGYYKSQCSIMNKPQVSISWIAIGQI